MHEYLKSKVCVPSPTTYNNTFKGASTKKYPINSLERKTEIDEYIKKEKEKATAPNSYKVKYELQKPHVSTYTGKSPRISVAEEIMGNNNSPGYKYNLPKFVS